MNSLCLLTRFFMLFGLLILILVNFINYYLFKIILFLSFLLHETKKVKNAFSSGHFSSFNCKLFKKKTYFHNFGLLNAIMQVNLNLTSYFFFKINLSHYQNICHVFFFLMLQFNLILIIILKLYHRS
jgi:hypothetical protein